MATRSDVSNHARRHRNSTTTWADLERGLAATLPALGQAHLVIATKVGNRFVQFAADPEDGLRAETVSNGYLKPNDRHTATQVAALRELGWNEPTHAPDAPDGERVDRGSPNYFRDWAPTAVPWDEVARLAVNTLRIIGVGEPSALEYEAWDAEDRPLSLPALRLAARKVRPARRRPQRRPSKRGSKPLSKAARVSPKVREARAKLLAAVRVFSANNSLQYDEDGEIPMRIGGSPGWARLVEQPLLVKLYCLVARDVEVTDALLRRIHEINTEWFVARLILAGRNVYAVADFPADPFCIEHFTSCCAALLAIEREHGDEVRSSIAAAPATVA